MQNAIISALVAGGIAALGWFVSSWLTKKREKETRKFEEAAAQNKALKEAVTACFTKAVYTPMHAQVQLKAMHASLVNTRVSLQKLFPSIEAQKEREWLLEIINRLNFIENHKGDNEKIGKAKEAVQDLVVKLAESAGMNLKFPTPLDDTYFDSPEKAGEPPTGPA